MITSCVCTSVIRSQMDFRTCCEALWKKRYLNGAFIASLNTKIVHVTFNTGEVESSEYNFIVKGESNPLFLYLSKFRQSKLSKTWIFILENDTSFFFTVLAEGVQAYSANFLTRLLPGTSVVYLFLHTNCYVFIFIPDFILLVRKLT